MSHLVQSASTRQSAWIPTKWLDSALARVPPTSLCFMTTFFDLFVSVSLFRTSKSRSLTDLKLRLHNFTLTLGVLSMLLRFFAGPITGKALAISSCIFLPPTISHISDSSPSAKGKTIFYFNYLKTPSLLSRIPISRCRIGGGVSLLVWSWWLALVSPILDIRPLPLGDKIFCYWWGLITGLRPCRHRQTPGIHNKTRAHQVQGRGLGSLYQSYWYHR